MTRSILLALILISGGTPASLWAGDSLGPYVGLRVRDEVKSSGSSALVSRGGYQERRGSGVVVGASPSGDWYVLTNNHVVAPESKQKVPIPAVYLDGDWRTGRVLRTDADADLALVLVNSPKKLTITLACRRRPCRRFESRHASVRSGNKMDETIGDDSPHDHSSGRP